MKKYFLMLAVLCIALAFSASIILAAEKQETMNPTQKVTLPADQPKSPDMRVGTIIVDNLKAQNFSANEARIKTLSASLIRAKKIEASLIRAKKIETAELVAARAEIKQLNVEIANIKLANIELARIKQAEIETANIKLANIQQANIELAKIKLAEIDQANIKQANIGRTAQAKPCPDGKKECFDQIKLPAKTDWNYYGPNFDRVRITDPSKATGVALSKIEVFPGGKARVQVSEYNEQSAPTARSAAFARAQNELLPQLAKFQGRPPGTCLPKLHKP